MLKIIVVDVNYYDEFDQLHQFTEYHHTSMLINDFCNCQVKAIALDILDRNKDKFQTYFDNFKVGFTFKHFKIADFQPVYEQIAYCEEFVLPQPIPENEFEAIVERKLHEMLPESFHSFVKDVATEGMIKEFSHSNLSLKTKLFFIDKTIKALKAAICEMN